MSTPTPPSQSLHPDAPASVAQRLWLACQPRLPFLFWLFAASAVLVFLGDWVVHWSFLRPWMQICATVLAVLAGLAAAGKPDLDRFERFLVSSLVLALISALLDSHDGHQDYIPLNALLLGTYSGIAAHSTRALIRSHHLRPWRRYIAIVVGGATTGVYFSMMLFYLAATPRIAFIATTHESFPAYSFALIAVLHWIGKIYPSTSTLHGNVRRCPECDVLNIPERSICKRCGAVLGGVEHIE